MLTDKETTFAKELLAYLETEDLISLTKTTTNDVILPTSRNEAVSAIILHTESIHVLLSRKKITKDILFKYLHDRQQCVSISEQRDQLKKRVLGLVGIRDRRTVRFDESVHNLGNESDDSGAGSDISGSEDFDRKEICGGQLSVQLSSSSTQETTPNALLSSPQSLGILSGAQAQGVMSGPQSLSALSSALCRNISSGAQSQSVAQYNNHQLSSNAISVQQEFPVIEFSQQFVTWFFNLLNAGSFPEDHFWMDATAEILLLPEDKVSQGRTASGVSELLSWVKNVLGVTFNPNVSVEGVQGTLDAHGLMIVFACGTLHTPDRCLGVFTQQFSLARDPFSNNNWKIKNTRAILRCPEYTLDLVANGMPRLDGPNSDIRMLI